MGPDLLMACLLAQAAATPDATLKPGDAVVVVERDRSIRGRIHDLSNDSLTIDAGGTRVALPLHSVQQIDRLGDAIADGTAIGAALGGASALAAMAVACSNTDCADTSASLDPRLTLVAALAGAGIGAVIDGARQARKTIFRTGGQPPTLGSSHRADPLRWTAFVRGGWGGLSDDEGSLGDGPAVGAGILMPLGRRGGLQLAYDRQNHRREIESGAPPGLAQTGGFHGTEQFLTAKALLFFRQAKTFRPYAGIGGGLFESQRTSEFPTYLPSPDGAIVPGPTEAISYRTREFAIGFAAGGLWRVTDRFSILSDLSLELALDGLSAARATAGGAFHF